MRDHHVYFCVCFNYSFGGARLDHWTIFSVLLCELVRINLHVRREALVLGGGEPFTLHVFLSLVPSKVPETPHCGRPVGLHLALEPTVGQSS